MIDYFALALSHALLLLMLWRIQQRPDLDREEWIEQGAPEATGDDTAADPLTERQQHRARGARGTGRGRGQGGSGNA